MKYRIEYSNGVVVYKGFSSVEEANFWKHNEGDHVISFERIT